MTSFKRSQTLSGLTRDTVWFYVTLMLLVFLCENYSLSLSVSWWYCLPATVQKLQVLHIQWQPSLLYWPRHFFR